MRKIIKTTSLYYYRAKIRKQLSDKKNPLSKYQRGILEDALAQLNGQIERRKMKGKTDIPPVEEITLLSNKKAIN